MKEIVAKALRPSGLSHEEIIGLVEVPKERERGDYAFPCFVLASRLKKNPVVIAQEIAKTIKLSKEVARVEAVGPYINFFMNDGLLAKKTIQNILQAKQKYGAHKGDSSKIMIEFSQANTHKAFHVGHIRGTSIGESLARILTFTGNRVVRANYQGDTGMHVAKWLWCYTNFHKNEAIKKDEAWFAHIYVEAVRRLAETPTYEKEVEDINRALESGKDKRLVGLWKKTRRVCLDSLEIIYKQLETRFDQYFFESDVEKRGKAIAHELVTKKIAEISEEATIINFEHHGSPDLGVWVLLRSDGTVLYSAKDIALAERKFNTLKIEQAVYVVGSEQRQHIYQLFKALELMKFKQAAQCVYLPVSLVRLPTGKMSSRTGDNVLYSAFREELIEQARKEIRERDAKLSNSEVERRAGVIALAAMKYTMLKQDLNKVIVFDKEEALRFEGDTGPYLLYSYARAQSILRKVIKRKGTNAPTHLESSERALINELAAFPDSVLRAAKMHDPSTLAHYTYTLAQTFNEFYHRCPVVGSDREGFRTSLVRAYTYTLENALHLLGIPVLKEM